MVSLLTYLSLLLSLLMSLSLESVSIKSLFDVNFTCLGGSLGGASCAGMLVSADLIVAYIGSSAASTIVPDVWSLTQLTDQSE